MAVNRSKTVIVDPLPAEAVAVIDVGPELTHAEFNRLHGNESPDIPVFRRGTVVLDRRALARLLNLPPNATIVMLQPDMKTSGITVTIDGKPMPAWPAGQGKQYAPVWGELGQVDWERTVADGR